MRKILLLLFVLTIGFTATDCKKKNYPNDIPGWLRKKIEAMNEDNKKYNKGLFFSRKDKYCHYGVARMVDEYFNGSSTYYWIGSGYNGWTVYNSNGIKVCETPPYGPPPCGGTHEYGYYDTFVRNVWAEDCH
jgi:hypothetical protein